MKDCEPSVIECNEVMVKVSKEYTEICDFFMIGKNDDMRQKSELFFKFFTSFFDDV